MGYSANWHKIANHLKATERILAYDQRGHGRSMKPESGYAPEDYASDLLKITEEIGWDKFILVGHSMGGRNVLNFAFQHPEKVSHLIVEDIGPEASDEALPYFERLLGLVPTPFPNREAARSFFQGEFMEIAKSRDKVDMLAKFFYSNLEDQSDGTTDWRFSKKAIFDSVIYGRAEDRSHEVAGLKVPTLWIRGGVSRELSRENYEKVLALNPLITGVEIPNAGHWVHADQPELFTQALKDFVGGFQ
jgi:esterase